MNKEILADAAQQYILAHQNDDVSKIAMAKSPISGIEPAELAEQISAKRKAAKKLPTWFNAVGIYYPSVLSIEQTSSEVTAKYKADLATGKTLLDITGGFGVDGYFFSKKMSRTIHCEIDTRLLEITAHNARILNQQNTLFRPEDGIEFLKNSNQYFDTIYADPARRGKSGKVFLLKDCSPDVVANIQLLLERSGRLIIKTAPLLDISAGIQELKSVAEIHIVSVKNECKELLWVLEKKHTGFIKVVAATLNGKQKTFSFSIGDEQTAALSTATSLSAYLYEPDVALLKSGAFNLIAERYNIQKLAIHTQLYSADNVQQNFPGRIFKINSIIRPGSLKKEKGLKGNVIVRNYRDTPEMLVKKYKIEAHQTRFLVFTYSDTHGYIVINVDIIQHY